MAYLVVFLRLFVVALYIVLLGRVLMSWIDPRFQGRAAHFFYETTEPILAPIRRALPISGPLDWSPLVAFVALSIVAGAIGVG
ncbi:MAG: YggT family protein [Candidatus Limnocylindrales bacterium]